VSDAPTLVRESAAKSLQKSRNLARYGRAVQAATTEMITRYEELNFDISIISLLFV
jgi:hypothetical protein